MTDAETDARERIAEVLSVHFYDDPETAVDATRDLLSALSDLMEAREPTATRSIQDLRRIASMLDLDYFYLGD